MSADSRSTIHHGGALDVLRSMPGASFDACLTDPPYGLTSGGGRGFMGNEWDARVPSLDVWAEVLRTLKPGGMLMAFGGTRTFHRLTCAIEDAGFEIRDCIAFAWIYGSGFPKSHNFGCKCSRATVQYSHGIQSQDVRVLRPEMDTADAVPGSAEPLLLNGLFAGDEGLRAKEGRPRNKVLRVRKDVSFTAEPQRSRNHAELLEEVQREDTSKSAYRTLGKHEGPQAKGRADGTLQPGVEGRRDFQAEQGQLHRPEVCPLPPGSSGDGTEGRLCDGAPSGYGWTSRPNTEALGSGSPQGPQHAEQHNREPGTIPEQRGTQAGRGICETCGGVVGFEGFGTALKPAFEPIVLGMKPLDGMFADNALKHGVAGLNIDGSRIGTSKDVPHSPSRHRDTRCHGQYGSEDGTASGFNPNIGRWPSNLLLDEDAAAHLGEPARFFYVAKASTSERNSAGTNQHPCVKPVRLATYLATMLLPPERDTPRRLLVPYSGSGSEIIGALRAGWDQVEGIENVDEYVKLSRSRIAADAPLLNTSRAQSNVG